MNAYLVSLSISAQSSVITIVTVIMETESVAFLKRVKRKEQFSFELMLKFVTKTKINWEAFIGFKTDWCNSARTEKLLSSSQ